MYYAQRGWVLSLTSVCALVVSGVLFFAPLGPVFAQEAAAPEVPFQASEVVLVVNAERVVAGLPPLTPSLRLDLAALLKGQHMAQGGYFAHTTPEGYAPWHFFNLAGYTYAHAGENLAIDYFSPDDVVAAMMQSPAHKDNILGSQYTEVAVAVVPAQYNGALRYMVVMLFGTPL